MGAKFFCVFTFLILSFSKESLIFAQENLRGHPGGVSLRNGIDETTEKDAASTMLSGESKISGKLVRTPTGIGNVGPKGASDFKEYIYTHLGLKFSCPGNWILSESGGPKKGFRNIHIYGPRNEDLTFSNSFVIAREPVLNVDEIQTTIDKRLSQVKKFKESSILNYTSISLFPGLMSQEITFSHSVHLPLLSSDGFDMVLCETDYYTHKDGYLYHIKLMLDKRDYDNLKPVFDQFVQSIQFLP